MSTPKTNEVPEGYTEIKRVGPFLGLFGPIYHRADGARSVIGLRISEKHLNMRGIAHGGMLVALADSALGINLSRSTSPPVPMVTINLSTDFADAARLGDWIEAHVDIQKVGARLAFANCYLRVGKRRILRASGVFAIVGPVTPEPDDERFDG